MVKLFVVVAVLATLISCANPVNRKTAVNYNKAAYSAMRSGEWAKSRMYFGRAIQNSKFGGVNPKKMAVLWYEYGRTSGVICDWPEAERGLNEAYKFDSENGGPAFMSLYELGRMYYDRKLYPKASDYFTRVEVEFNKIEADTKDPLGYAEFLEEFATALEQTGNSTDAEKHRARATELRKTFPGKRSHTEKTPYGTQCAASQPALNQPSLSR